MRAFRFRLYPNKTQKQMLLNSIEDARVLWNYLLECIKIYHGATGKFLSRRELYFQTKNTSLYSQVAQNQADKLNKAIKYLLLMRKQKIRAGFPRFKKFGNAKSITYPQFGFRIIGKKLELAKVGLVNIRLHREILGKIKTLTIKQEPSGKWFAIFVVLKEKINFIPNGKPKVGIDLGLERIATVSDGKIIPNPKFQEKDKRILKRRHQLHSRKNNSKNWIKACSKLWSNCN